MAGGKREGAGRPANLQKKVVYSTVKLRPEQVDWLRKQKRGMAAKIFESAVDDAMLSTKNREDIIK